MKQGRLVGVVFRGHHESPPVKRAVEGERLESDAEASEAEDDLKTRQRLFTQPQSAQAGEPGVTHGNCMRHVRGVLPMNRGREVFFSQDERREVERSLVCGGTDAQA